MNRDAELRGLEDDGGLREAFAALAVDALATADCPPADQLWEAAQGELDEDAAADVIDHTAGCAACAEAWRLSRELEPGGGEAEQRAAAPQGPGRRWRWSSGRVGLLAAAALLAVAVGWRGLDPSGPPAGPTFRGGESENVRSLVSGVLPRGDFVLRWQGAEGARYDLRVLTEDMVTVLAEASALEVSEYRVPEEALTGLAPGSTVFWHVATRVEGEPAAAATFETRVE